jgi:hypothetical protein
MQINETLARQTPGYINDNEVVRSTQDFVRINSVNPHLEAGSEEPALHEKGSVRGSRDGRCRAQYRQLPGIPGSSTCKFRL